MADNEVLKAIQVLRRHGLLDEYFTYYSNSNNHAESETTVFLPEIVSATLKTTLPDSLEYPRNSDYCVELHTAGGKMWLVTFNTVAKDKEEALEMAKDLIKQWRQIKLHYANL